MGGGCTAQGLSTVPTGSIDAIHADVPGWGTRAVMTELTVDFLMLGGVREEKSSDCSESLIRGPEFTPRPPGI